MDKKLRILMLEANSADATAVAKELRKAGISFESRRVETKQHYEEGLQEYEPNLILADYWLPSFDGVSALTIAQEMLPEAPFIFVSGALGEELAIDAMKHGATDYVLKVGLSRLVPAVRRAMRESEERAERKLAQEKLRESEERLKSIFEGVATGVIIIDPETHKIVDANPAAVEMIGFPREGIVGQTCHKSICPARKGHCPVTDLGQDLDRAEQVMLTAGGEVQVLKTATRVVLEGREHLLESFVDVSDSKKMEKALRESEDAARTLLNAPIGAVAMVDAGLCVLAINETGAQAFGRPSAELVGASILDRLEPNVAQARAERFKKVLKTGKPEQFEDERDSTFFENAVFPLFDERGKVNRLVIFGQDITKRKLVEVAQKKDRDFISKVLDTAGALVMVVETEGRIVLFNRTAEEVSGFRFDEVRGKPPWDVFIDPTQAKAIRAAFMHVAGGGTLGPWEALCLTKSGELRNIAGSHATLLGQDGEVEYLIVTATDITESRQAEVALKESEERYRSVFGSTGTAMCIVDQEATITFLNSEFERISGYPAEDITSKKKFGEFLGESQVEDFLGYMNELDRISAHGTEGPVHFECSFTDREGRVLTMLANMGRLPGSGAGTNAISLIDITREKEYEQDLRERAERLRDFLVVASHELRHPIAIVKGYANTLTEYMERMPHELVQEILDDINLSTDRLTRYVEQLLDVSRVEQGRLFVNREASDPEILLKMALDDTRVMGVENQFITRVAVTGPIAVDTEKFVQLVHILIDNAVKFSPKGSPIEIEVERSGDVIMVSVMDRGNGIPEESRAKVFDRFYQVEDALHHSKPGMGLGLYIAGQIVDAHDGRVWVEPRDGGGSVFKFTLR